MKKIIHCPACGEKIEAKIDNDTRKEYFRCPKCTCNFSLVFNLDKILKDIEIQYSLGG